jgi:hypothetical protein
VQGGDIILVANPTCEVCGGYIYVIDAPVSGLPQIGANLWSEDYSSEQKIQHLCCLDMIMSDSCLF